MEVVSGQYMIKNPSHWFESNPMDRSYPMSSSGSINIELWEEDLWPVDIELDADFEGVEDGRDKNCNDGQFVIQSTGFNGSLRTIPTIGDSSLDAGFRRHHQSAPVNVPDWGKILGVDSRKEQYTDADDFDMADEKQEERLPPHEYLAREHARCRIFRTSSVWPGVGLKGREMNRVRNAVWRQTGFLG